MAQRSASQYWRDVAQLKLGTGPPPVEIPELAVYVKPGPENEGGNTTQTRPFNGRVFLFGVQNVLPDTGAGQSTGTGGQLVPVYRSIHATWKRRFRPTSRSLAARTPTPGSVEGGERLGRFSFIGTDPYNVMISGPGQEYVRWTPLTLVEDEMSRHKLIPVDGLPGFHGGAGGLRGLRRHPLLRATRARDARGPQGVPESVFMFGGNHPDIRPFAPRHQGGLARQAGQSGNPRR